MVVPSARDTYLVLADVIRRDIGDGRAVEWLPSEAELRSAHGVARSTVRRALRVLANEGLIVPVPGAGWRVGPRPDTPLAVRVWDVVRDDGLEVGDRFPSEAALCERLAASRTAVRAALKELEGRGLLAVVHGKGRTVRAFPEEDGST